MKATELVIRATHSAADVNQLTVDTSLALSLITMLNMEARRVKEAVGAIKVRLKNGHGRTRLLALQLLDHCMRGCGSKFHGTVASSLLPRILKIALETRAATDANTAVLQREAVQCIREWGTQLLPRVQPFADAARRVARLARQDENARHLSSYVEKADSGHWTSQPDGLSSVGSLSSLGSTGSGTSVLTISSAASSDSGAMNVATSAAETLFDDGSSDGHSRLAGRDRDRDPRRQMLPVMQFNRGQRFGSDSPAAVAENNQHVPGGFLPYHDDTLPTRGDVAYQGDFVAQYGGSGSGGGYYNHNMSPNPSGLKGIDESSRLSSHLQQSLHLDQAGRSPPTFAHTSAYVDDTHVAHHAAVAGSNAPYMAASQQRPRAASNDNSASTTTPYKDDTWQHYHTPQTARPDPWHDNNYHHGPHSAPNAQSARIGIRRPQSANSASILGVATSSPINSSLALNPNVSPSMNAGMMNASNNRPRPHNTALGSDEPDWRSGSQWQPRGR